MLVIIESGLRQGLLLIPLAVGIHVAFRFARYPDLTADGSVLIGGSLSAVIILNTGSPAAALALGALGGGLLGCMTAFLSEFVGLDRILAGISSSLLAYTLALRVLGRGNVPIPPDVSTLFSAESSDLAVSGVFAVATVVVVCFLAISKIGLRLRAVGENEELAAQLGGRVGLRFGGGLFWANSLVGLTGALLAQHQRFTDVSQGAGTLFAGLACVLIGGAIPVGGRLILGIVASAAGAIIYACLISAALRIGFRPGDLKAVTAVLVVATAWFGARFFLKGERSPLFQ